MYGVNLDLLHAKGSHRRDGSPKDPHAHHRAEHRALLAEERSARWKSVAGRAMAFFRQPAARQAKAECTRL